MNSANFNVVPLRQASLCMDCETITAAHTNCLACGSQALLGLARVLSEPSSDFSRRVSTEVVPISLSPLHKRHTCRPSEPN